MSKSFGEIDHLVRRTNKLYLSYFLLSLSLSTYSISFTKYSKPTKIILVLSLSLLASGCFTWAHIFKTFSAYEIAYLRVGLDKSYASIKSSNNKS